MRNFIFLFALLLSLESAGQALIKSLDASAVFLAKSMIVTTNDGTQIDGVKFTAAISTDGMISSFTIKTADGEKKKI